MIQGNQGSQDGFDSKPAWAHQIEGLFGAAGYSSQEKFARTIGMKRGALTGHLRCGYCGGPMCLRKARTTQAGGLPYSIEYYKCLSASRQVSFCPQSRQIRVDQLEPAVRERIIAALSDAHTQALAQGEQSTTDQIEISKLDDLDARWQEAFAAGAISAVELREYRELIRRQRAALKQPQPVSKGLLESMVNSAHRLSLVELVSLSASQIIASRKGHRISVQVKVFAT